MVWVTTCGHALVKWYDRIEQESGSLSVQPFFEFKTESERSKFMAGDFSFYTQTCGSVADEHNVNLRFKCNPHL